MPEALGRNTGGLISAFFFFFIAACIGLTLRFAFVVEMPEWFKYKNFEHAHSHVAMIGWLTAAFYLFACRFFELNSRIYSHLFWAIQFSVLGMLVSFPIQGYAFFSICFTSLYMLLVYAFSYFSWRSLRLLQKKTPRTSILFFKTALFFLAFSTMGVWALAFIMNSPMKGSALYYNAVQFFLHFQFNGWFVFALLALFFRLLEKEDILIPLEIGKRLYYLLVVSCFLTYALSVSWSTPDKLIFWTNSLGVLLQAFALFYLITLLRNIKGQAQEKLSSWHFLLWGIAFFCLSFKILIQTLVAIPYLATISYTIHNFVIGFIHLLMLGSLSVFIIGLSSYCYSIHVKKGTYMFLIGFALTEMLLFGQGALLWAERGFIPHYHLLLALASVFLVIGLFLLLFSVCTSKIPSEGNSKT